MRMMRCAVRGLVFSLLCTVPSMLPGQAGVITPGKIVPTVPAGRLTPIPAAVDFQNLSPLLNISGNMLPDEGSKLFYHATGTATLSIAQPVTLEVLTRNTVSYNTLALQFIDPAAAPTAPVQCQPMTPPPGLLGTSTATFVASTAPPDLVTVLLQNKQVSKGSAALNLLTLTGTIPDAINKRVAAGQTTALLRVIPIAPSLNPCMLSASAPLLATFYDPSKASKTNPFPQPAPPKPEVYSAATLISYTPEIPVPYERCDFIVTGPVTDAKFGAIMTAAGVPKSVGTHFNLCSADAERIYNELPGDIKAGIVLKSLLSYFGAAFNWTAAEFQKLASDIGTPIVGEKYGKLFGEVMLGQFPGSPLTGDVNALVDRGCAWVKQQTDDKIDDNAQKGQGDTAKEPANDVVDQFCSALKTALNSKDNVNSFLMHDPANDPHRAFLTVKVDWYGTGGAPATMTGGARPLDATVFTTGDSGPNCVGSCGHPGIPLYTGQIALDSNVSGKTATIPIFMDSQSYMKGGDFQQGFVDNRHGLAQAGPGTPFVKVFLLDPYPENKP